MPRSRGCARRSLGLPSLTFLLAQWTMIPLALAEVPVEEIGRVATIATPYDPHWVFVGDALAERTAIVDLESGAMLGTIDAGFGIPQTLHPTRRSEIYMVETHYSRGSRGERTDVLTIYDKTSLAPVDEISLPPKRAISATPVAHTALTDDDRFALVFNLTPATSVSVVDLEARQFASEIQTPGCSLVYPTGPRSFAMLCMNGGLLIVTLDDTGRMQGMERSEPFFDPALDPVSAKAARHGDRWLFPSFAGVVHTVDFSAAKPAFEATWSLTTAAEHDDDWKIGGYQHLAVHSPSKRLFALMHQGGPDTHKSPGSEVWVYDLETRTRVARFELVNPGFTYLGIPIEGGPTWGWLVDWISDRIMDAVPELGITSIAVTSDDEPRLVTSGMFSGGIASFDARSGKFLGRVFSGNLTNVVLQTEPPRAASPR